MTSERKIILSNRVWELIDELRGSKPAKRYEEVLGEAAALLHSSTFGFSQKNRCSVSLHNESNSSTVSIQFLPTWNIATQDAKTLEVILNYFLYIEQVLGS